MDSEGTPTLLNCLMYKLSYYRFGDLKLDYHTPAGFDRTRNAVIGNKDIDLTYLEEAYTTEHWLVRIYRYVGVILIAYNFFAGKLTFFFLVMKLTLIFLSRRTSKSYFLSREISF